MTSYIRTILFLILLNIIFFQLSQSQDSLYLIATITGDSIGDQFSVVTGVGDINGDGYDDVVVGAPGGNYAKLFLGGPVFDTIPDLIFYGEQPGSQFGRSVAGGKDINGDAFPDIIISAPDYCFGGCMYGIVNSGKVYVYFGGPNIDNEPDIVFYLYGWYYHFGYSLDIAGDLNGDRYNDLIISAPHDDYDAHGRVYIYFGGPHLDSTYDILLEGNDHFDMFGWSVSSAGDVNGDDYDDFLVGAPQDLSGGAGKAYLLYGGTDINISRSVVFSGDSMFRYGSFGRVVAGLGDINGDGFNDFGIMGLNKTNIYFGNTPIDTIPKMTLYPGRDFGYLGNLGDLNKDGFNDFVAVSDSVKMYFGSASPDTIPDVLLMNWAAPICPVGNVNSDKHNEIACAVSGGWDPTGRVSIYSYGLINGVNEHPLHNQRDIKLYQNFPNPFNNSTIITLTLPKEEYITVRIFDVVGREIRKLFDGKAYGGVQRVVWDGKNDFSNEVGSGTYIYRIQMEHLTQTKKMTLIR
ncbi:MAG: T9SS type A sorting domain-containing protein [Bacteroidota bacterium]|nr:T9SS type A sorting domain-containing protein [Bacteroidota bacterium]